MHRRISVAGSRGTVRFEGPLQGRNEACWLGVEWDDPSRGKHDGEHGGVRYFTCTSGEKAGSFVKPEKLDMIVSFAQAIRERYCGGAVDDGHVLETAGGQKKAIELVGMTSVATKQSKLTHLKTVCLSEARIGGITPEEDNVAELLPAVEELDLSGNLFSSWDEVSSILRQLGTLVTLNLSRNLLPPLSQSPELHGFENLRMLVLNGCKLSWDQACHVLSCTSNLEELYLSQNDISHLSTPTSIQPFQSLKTLCLDENAIADWAEVMKLSALPALQKLLLSDNAIQSVSYPVTESSPVEVQDGATEASSPFSQLKFLSLNRNRISAWESVDALNAFPSLSSVRFQDNPLCEEFSPGVMRSLIVARVKNLCSLNGSAVREREREDAQRWYVQRVAGEAYRMLQTDFGGDKEKTDAWVRENHPRYPALAEEYGDLLGELERTEKKATGDDPDAALLTEIVRITISPRGRCASKGPMEKRVPSRMTVSQLKALCNRLYSIETSDQLLYMSSRDLPVPEALTQDHRDLSYYGFRDGFEVILEEYDEKIHGARKEAEAAKLNDSFNRQLARADDEIRMRAAEMEQQKAAVARSTSADAAN
eukprot:Rmarinus@m.30226